MAASFAPLVLAALTTRLPELRSWALNEGLEIVMLVSGAVLLTRAAQWMLRRYAAELAAGAEAGRPGSASLDLRRRQALVQASGWVVTATVTIITAALIAMRVGVPLSTVVPPATIAGVAVGFGAQRVVQDVLSGFFMLSERQLAVGDSVRIASPGAVVGVTGTVEEVTLRVTRLRTLKGEVVFIPNGEIRQVINLSMEWARLVVDVPLRAVEDVNAAIPCLEAVVAAMAGDEPLQEALLEGPQVLGVQAIEPGVVTVRVVARVRAADQWAIGRELRLRIASGLAEAGIATASPIMATGGTE